MSTLSGIDNLRPAACVEQIPTVCIGLLQYMADAVAFSYTGAAHQAGS